MKSVLLSIAFFIPLVAHTQWATYSPFGDTIGVYSIALNDSTGAWFLACRTDGRDIGMVARTIDGGATFNTSILPMQNPPYTACITSIDKSTAFVIGLQNWGNGITLKTVDGGQTWQDTKTPWDSVLSWPNYIHAFTPAKICQMGDPRDGEFEIYNTQNGGISWTKIAPDKIPDALPGEIGFNNGGCAVGNHIWFATSRGRVYHSDNAGNTWDVKQTPLDAIGTIAYADENNGITTFWGNPNGSDVLLRTKNGGTTWDSIKLPISETYHFYGTPSYMKGTAVMVAGVYTEPQFLGKNQTWVSKDRGNTWEQISEGEIIGWPNFNSSTNGWAGEWGPIIPTDHTTRVYKYIGNPIVGLFSLNALNAELRISPNPATDLVQLQVKTPEPVDFLVLLNDASGKLLKSFSLKNTAEFTQAINVQGLPSGTYTLSVSTSKGSVSRKFLIN
ncbi:MAG: T9SS type A sorting domain-containing protein [Saprospiraceae bacterium]